MSSVYGLENEIESLKERMEEAIKNGDTDKENYLEERISRVEKEIQGKNDYNDAYH